MKRVCRIDVHVCLSAFDCVWVWEVSWCPASLCNYSSSQHRLILIQTTICSRKSQLFLFTPQHQCVCAASETPLTHSRLFNPLFLHLSLPFFHHHHLTILLLSPFILVFPPISLLWVWVGERRTGGNWCNEFRALMLAEASLPWLLVAINLPHSVRAKCAHNRQRGSSNWLPITRLWIKDMERGGGHNMVQQ